MVEAKRTRLVASMTPGPGLKAVQDIRLLQLNETREWLCTYKT